MPTLTGFENHRGTAVRGPEARPLGRIVTGVGNGDDRSEGAMQGTIVATYLHGPVLVRNPALADLLLSRGSAATCLPSTTRPWNVSAPSDSTRPTRVAIAADEPWSGMAVEFPRPERRSEPALLVTPVSDHHRKDAS